MLWWGIQSSSGDWNINLRLFWDMSWDLRENLGLTDQKALLWGTNQNFPIQFYSKFSIIQNKYKITKKEYAVNFSFCVHKIGIWYFPPTHNDLHPLYSISIRYVGIQFCAFEASSLCDPILVLKLKIYIFPVYILLCTK